MGLLESLVRSRCVQAQAQALVMKTGSVAQWGSVTKPRGTDRSAECSMFFLLILVTTESKDLFLVIFTAAVSDYLLI